MNGALAWILASCAILSVYDICKKASVSANAVFPTLLGSTISGFAAVTAVLAVRGELAATLAVSPCTVGLLLLKSVIVSASWAATYRALTTLPITSAAPIRATGPLWTLVGAIAVFGEIPSVGQAIGMACVIAGCFVFSWSAAHEGVRVWRDRAVIFAFLGTVLGSVSALYDKCLIGSLGLRPATVLWWFMGGMSVIYACTVAASRRTARRGTKFEWRWTIPCVGILLALSDACYFTAVSTPEARISILSMIRRSSVILTFLIGGAVFHEKNLRRKAIALAAILTGVVILCLK